MADNHDTAPGLSTINKGKWKVVDVETIWVEPRDANGPTCLASYERYGKVTI